jgi:cytochrome c biogenesis factor
MSAPLLTTLGVKLHLTNHVASIKEDFYNTANFPVAVLLAVGMGLGPYLVWRKWQPDAQKLMWFYATSVIAAILFTIARIKLGSPLFGYHLAAQILFFAASMFALLANGYLLAQKLKTRRGSGEGVISTRTMTAGGVISHIGVAILFIGIGCLVTFVKRDSDVLLQQGKSETVLNGAYEITYIGQTSDYQTDRNNALKFAVASTDGHEKFTALLPFALRSMEGGTRQLFSHPGIAHHFGSDLYIALKDGPDEIYRTPRIKTAIHRGETKQIGPYQVQLIRLDRDPAAAAYVASTGQMPPVFPVTAVLQVTYKGKQSIVQPQFIMRRDDPNAPDTPEVKLPDGWLISFESMSAGSSDMATAGATEVNEGGTFAVREDSGPPIEAFELDVTTRPMIDLVWIGTLLMVLGGLISMRRRIIENRAAPDVDEDAKPASSNGRNGKNGHGKNGSAKPRARTAVAK